MKLKKMVLIVMSLISSVFAQDKPYSGAELYSNNTFMYGRYEARMYMAAGNGLVSSMFLYYNGPSDFLIDSISEIILIY